MTTLHLGKRIRTLRNECGLSQDELAQRLGFKDRQIVSAIETGSRRVTSDELVRTAEILDAPLEYFIDRFRLIGEGRFSWRQTVADRGQLRKYEEAAGCWIAAFRELTLRLGNDLLLMHQKLGLTSRSSFEDAMLAGEQFATRFGLGEIPAKRLIKVMEQDLGILVLMVDVCEGISGAACQLPELNTVLISRREVEGRRHFDLAHELFHLLTWDAMPPEHYEKGQETGGNRVEKLADNFAGAVLMPATILERYGDWSTLSKKQLIKKLNAVADELCVTSTALGWRLAALKKLKQTVVRSLPEVALRNNGRAPEKDMPALFSRPYAEVLGQSIERGFVSVRRVASLLDLTIDDLIDLFADHGVECSIGL